MKNRDWIKINFVGKVKATDEVFDVTREEDARRHDIYDEKKKYGPVLVIVGAGTVIPVMKGVEKELLEMKIGENRSFDVSPADGAGPRKPELIKVVSTMTFTKKNISPFPGLVLQTDVGHCKVLAVSGGRVRVDYNHPLAGKELHYEVEIVEQVKTPHEKVQALLEYYGIPANVTLTGKKATVTLEDKSNSFIEKLLTETLKKWCDGVDEVEFKSKEKPKAAKTVEKK
ncbi:MAG: FKBP-type peptidyl-prolyl cis-trans isomerase [Candidatus Aenigmatarchaeota archaeon]|nr:MAG: FKBP-type peptidyl-prolyl cis-trans isomerase [Candidatus Aenigmarchaeota archaeon]